MGRGGEDFGMEEWQPAAGRHGTRCEVRASIGERRPGASMAGETGKFGEASNFARPRTRTYRESARSRRRRRGRPPVRVLTGRRQAKLCHSGIEDREQRTQSDGGKWEIQGRALPATLREWLRRRREADGTPRGTVRVEGRLPATWHFQLSNNDVPHTLQQLHVHGAP